MNAHDIISRLRFTSREDSNQNGLFTVHHVKYKCTIYNRNNGKRYTFNYQCNPDFSKPEINDCLNCLLMDADSGEYDCADFLVEFGYNETAESIRNGLKAHKACKRTADALNRLFTPEELEVLRDHFADY